MESGFLARILLFSLSQRWLKSIFLVEILNQGTMCRWKYVKRFHGLQLVRRKRYGISVDLVSVLGFVVIHWLQYSYQWVEIHNRIHETDLQFLYMPNIKKNSVL